MRDYNSFSEQEVRHLEMLQSILARLASNSFSIKGWTVVIYAALLIFFMKDFNGPTCLSFVLLIPAAFFWILDGYYLNLERKYRKRYELVLQSCKGCSPFSLEPGEASLWESILSVSLILYYINFISISVLCILYIFNR